MPLYNYNCPICDTVTEEFVFNKDEVVFCEGCKRELIRQFPDKTGPINFGFPEDGIVLEHAEATPIHLRTRKEAKQYERKNNVKLGCL